MQESKEEIPETEHTVNSPKGDKIDVQIQKIKNKRKNEIDL